MTAPSSNSENVTDRGPLAVPSATARGVPALLIEGLGKAFGDRVLFEELALEIPAGEHLALIGESGSGKSTLLNLISGLDHAEHGRIRIAGQDVTGMGAEACAMLRRQYLGFVFQAFHLLPHLDATQNVALALLLQNQSPAQARERSRDLLSRLGLSQRLDALPSQLSGGEQQRVALARALVHRPSLVLADEPTGNLDADTARQALALMFECCAEQGSSLLMVTHSDFAASRCGRVLKLAGRRLQAA